MLNSYFDARSSAVSDVWPSESLSAPSSSSSPTILKGEILNELKKNWGFVARGEKMGRDGKHRHEQKQSASQTS